MMKYLIIFNIIFLNCVIDITGLRNHPVRLPEHTLVIRAPNIKSHLEFAYIFDIDSMKIVDSVCLSYYFEELNDFEFLGGNIEKTSQNYLAYSVKLKYSKRYVPDNIVRIVNLATGKIVKEINVMGYSGIVNRPFYSSGIKYVMVSDGILINILDFTNLKKIKEYRLDGYIGEVFQDIDNSIYYTMKSSPLLSSSTDSIMLRRLNPSDFKSYENIMNIGRHDAIVYNKKIYIFYNSEGIIRVFDLNGNLLDSKNFPYPYYPFGTINLINGYIFVSQKDNGWLLKIDPETFECKSIHLDYAPECGEIAYSENLNLLFTTSPILGAYFHIYFIDFDNFEIVSEYIDYKRTDGWNLEVIE